LLQGYSFNIISIGCVENWDYEFNKEMKINAEHSEVVFTVCGKDSGLAKF